MNTWPKLLQRATSVHEVLAISREYLASWSPKAWASLAEESRPGRIKGVDDVYFWRDQLLGQYCTGAARDQADSQLRELLAYFSAAAERADALHIEFDPVGAIPMLFSDQSIPRLFTSAQAHAR